MVDPIKVSDFDDFLLKSFRYYHFTAMPAEVRAHFDKIMSEKDYIGNMKKWAAWFFDDNGDQLDAPIFMGGDAEGNYKKLFKQFQSVFQNMDMHKDEYKDLDNKPALNFVESYFGAGKLFDKATALQEVDDYIQNTLINIIQGHKNAIQYNPNISSALGDMSLDEFIIKLQNKEYNRDVKFQKTLTQFFGRLQYAAKYDDEEIKREFEGSNLTPNNIPDVEEWFVPAYDANKFKQQLPGIFQTLVSDKKARDAFFACDSQNQIKPSYDKAVEYTDWSNKESKDYIKPEVAEELSFKQEIQKRLDNTYKYFFRQFTSLRGRRRFVSPYIEEIIDGIDANKIKPTDGLDAIVNKADDIKKKLKHNKAGDHFDWFVKQMKELKELMPKTFADDPLKHGKKLQDIVSQLIINAVNDGKEDEAKTAMEILSIVKYGYTTSRTIDAIQNTDFSIVSDKNLSWNKNAGVQFVTNAMDKTAKFAIVGVGRLAAMARNTYERNRTKFKGAPNANLSSAIEEWKQRGAIAKADAQNRHNTEITNWNNTIAANNHELSNLSAGGGESGQRIDASTIDVLRTNLTNLKTNKDNAKRTRDQAETDFKPYEEVYTENENLKNEVTNLKKEIDELDKQITDIKNKINLINKPTSGATLEDQATVNKLVAMSLQLQQERDAKEKQLVDADKAQTDYESANDTKLRDYSSKEAAYQTAENAFSIADKQYSDLNIDINKFDTCTQSNEECNKQIEKSNKTMAEWSNDKLDKCRRLMAHWDFLETGSMVSKFHLGQRAMNKRFKNEKQGLFDQIYQKYGYNGLGA